MSKALVPYKYPFVEPQSDNLRFQKGKFNENRLSVLNELRSVSGVPEIINKLNQDTVYKIVAAPKGAILHKDQVTGTVKGVFYKDGKIIEHAKLKAIRPSLIKAATAIGSQILLVSIAMQLNQIEKTLSQIISEFHNDRIAEIFSGVEQFQQSMYVQDNERQSRLIENAIQTLNTGLKKTVRSLKLQIQQLPDPDNKLRHNWSWKMSKSQKAKEKIRIAEESFFSSILGIRTLSECFAALNEPIAAESVLKKQVLNLKDCGIKIAAEKARLIEQEEGILPEAPWYDFLKYEPELHKNLESCKLCNPASVETIEVEFKPVELSGGTK
jgi:hypothetical protein